MHRGGWIAVGGLGLFVVLYAAWLTLALGLIEAGATPGGGLALAPGGSSRAGGASTGESPPGDGPAATGATAMPAVTGTSVTSPATRATATPRRLTATPPPPGPTPVSGVDWPKLAELGEREPQATTAHFQVFADDPDDALLGKAVDRWTPELEALLDRTRAKLGGRSLPTSPVQLVFTRAYDARCPARGLAATAHDPPLLMIFMDEATTELQLRAVLAHEMAHHLTLDERFVGDGILTEGIANWAADGLMLEWQDYPSWDAAVRDYLARGEYVSITDRSPLSPRPGEDCIARRDRVYNARTSFVDWLVRRVGLDTVLAMPYVEIEMPRMEEAADAEDGESAQSEEGAGGTSEGGDADSLATPEPEILRVPDYEAATGLDLAALERLWLAEVRAGGRPEAG